MRLRQMMMKMESNELSKDTVFQKRVESLAPELERMVQEGFEIGVKINQNGSVTFMKDEKPFVVTDDMKDMLVLFVNSLRILGDGD